MLRDFNTRVFEGIRNRKDAPPEIRSFFTQPKPLLVTKASLRPPCTATRRWMRSASSASTRKGKVVGERLFVGLFTSVAYSRSPWDIPLLRHKVAQVSKRAGFAKNSHDDKALQHILETFPRDELFQATEDELYEIAIGILNLQERQRVALFIRRDPYERFISCFVYLPRDRMTTDIRLTIQEDPGAGLRRQGLDLLHAYGGRAAGAPQCQSSQPRPARFRRFNLKGYRDPDRRCLPLLARPAERGPGRDQGRGAPAWAC